VDLIAGVIRSLTFNFDPTLVIIVRTRQADTVIEVLDRADVLVAAVAAVILPIADLRLIYALVIIAEVHVVRAVYASLPHFVIIELLVGLKRAG